MEKQMVITLEAVTHLLMGLLIHCRGLLSADFSLEYGRALSEKYLNPIGDTLQRNQERCPNNQSD
jgi:hypothetical protein